MFDNDFLLKGETARSLYNNLAKDAPIYDYHCHLSAKEIFYPMQGMIISEGFSAV